MTIHVSGVAKNRILAAIGVMIALSPGISSADTPDPISGSDKMAIFERILEDRVAAGEIVGAGHDIRGGIVSSPQVPQEGCFTDQVPGLHAEIQDRMRDATLMLLSTYETSTGETVSIQGTGTVITADQGENRVLTASHVASPLVSLGDGEIGELISVHAFDGEGRLVARLAPTYANIEPVDVASWDLDLVHDDVTVLAPTHFPSLDMANGWNTRGLSVAPEQGTNLLFFHGEAGLTTIGSGYSGASLVNEDGMVVGVVTETAGYGVGATPAPNTMMPEAIGLQDLSGLGPEARDAIEAMISMPNESVYLDGVAAGPPLSSSGVLNALGVDPDRISVTRTTEASHLFSAGFPSRECRLSSLTLEDVSDAPYRENPDLHQVLPVDIAFVMARQGETGFGAVDFLSTMEAIRSVEVIDPFAGGDADLEPGQ